VRREARPRSAGLGRWAPEALAGLALLLAALAVAAGPAFAAERGDWVRQVRVEGAVEVPAAGAGVAGSALRERALRAAVARAVDDVALDLLAASPRVPPEFDEDALDAVLGGDPLDYAVRFSVLEDRGLRPRREASGSAAEAEYVVRASVHVDVARVRGRLEAAGLLDPPPPASPGRVVEVVLVPVDSYAALAWVREAIESGGGGRAVPAELARGRAVLRVTTGLEPEGLLGLLRREAPPGLRIALRGLDARSLTLEVEGRHLAPPGAAGSDAEPPAGAAGPRRGD